MSNTLPIEMVDAIKTKVRSGEHATDSEVIRDGMRALMVRDRLAAEHASAKGG